MISQRRLLVSALLLASLIALAPSSAAQQGADGELQAVQAHIDRGDPVQALEALKRVMKKGKPSAEALLLRSTARIMTGSTAEGFKDLERALKLDPGLRQGWLNMAGLEIAEGRYEAAYKALLKAQELAPDDPDNHLNLGAAVVLQGRDEPAAEHFAKYLEAHPGSAEAAYLVASNYALGGFESQAVEHLRQAVKLDERLRLEARSDERFLGLASGSYKELLATDTFVPPAGAHTNAAAFKVPYRRKEPDLVYAMLDALKSHGIGYDPKVEATEGWALIWTPRMRLKIATQTDGTGVVRLSAAAESFTADEWQETTQALFRTVYDSLERAAARKR